MIYLVRHAIRQDRKDKSWPNTAENSWDTPLCYEGIWQSLRLGERLKTEKINHIFCSPFLRAVQTAHLVAQQLNLKIKVEHGFSEYLRKSWFALAGAEGPTVLPLKELVRHYYTVDLEYESYWTTKFPETKEMLIERTKKTALWLYKEYGDNLMFVGHGMSVKRATQGLAGYDTKIGTSCAGLTIVEKVRKEWELVLNNDRSFFRTPIPLPSRPSG